MATSIQQKVSPKQCLLLTALSVAVILLHRPLYHLLSILLNVHQMLINGLGRIFSSGSTGYIIEQTLALLLIPALAALIVSAIYWAFKRSSSPYTMPVVWLFWIILTALITIKGMI